MPKVDPMRMTEHQARQYLEAIRWPNGVVCAHCKAQSIGTVQGKSARPGLYQCKGCRRQFTVTVGTIFERSHVPLSKWVQAFHLLCSSKKGMSSLQLKRLLGVTYETAWHMTHRIRYAMHTPPRTPQLTGTVEVDETYVGGKPRAGAPAKPKSERQTPVIAMVERGGAARAKPLRSVSAPSLLKAVQQHVSQNAELMTDEFRSYVGLDRVYETRETVKHSAGEYARGRAYTNTAESFFALFKRGVTGSYHHISRKHLGRYCDEFAFRWSHRHLDDRERTKQALKNVTGRRLPYRTIIGN